MVIFKSMKKAQHDIKTITQGGKEYKNRECLRCDRTFASYGPQNRLCHLCIDLINDRGGTVGVHSFGK